MLRILFVDDDKFFGKPYVDCLKEQLAPEGIVDICTKIDDAIHYVYSHKDLSAIVLDVMMPPPISGDYVSEDIEDATEEGFGTGIWYLRLLKSSLVDRRVKVFVLTNRNFDDVRAALAEIGYPNGYVECDRKIAVPASMLPNRVLALLNRPVRE